MPDYDETERALVELLRTFGTEPRSLYDVGVPLVGMGYDQNRIVSALFMLESNGLIKLLPGKQLSILKSL